MPRNDPRPIAALVRTATLGTMALAGWWSLLLTPADRLQRLLTLARQEAVGSLPPDALLDQLTWLVLHRRQQLLSMAALLALGLVIGLGEGRAFRVQDVRAGVRLKVWTLGVVGLGFLVVAGGLYLILPWPLSQRCVALGLTVCAAGVGYALVVGQPSIL